MTFLKNKKKKPLLQFRFSSRVIAAAHLEKQKDFFLSIKRQIETVLF